MSALSSFQFLQPAWLLLLPLLWLLLGLFARHNLQRSMWRRLCDAPLLERMRAESRFDTGNRWLVWPLAAVLTLAVLAASGPSWRPQAYPILEAADARVIALDLSRGMLVEDVKPSRFAQARTAVGEIIGGDFDGETALLAYAGAAFVVSPLSRDAETLDAFIDSLHPGMMPLEGTRIDLAIERARDLLAASVTGNGQILLVASGSSQPQRAIQAASRARADGFRVSILAIGTRAGGPLIETSGELARDDTGAYRLAKTDLGALRRIAAAGGGAMIPLTQAPPGDVLLEARIRAGILAAEAQGAGDRNRPAANDGYWLVLLALPFALLLFRKNLLWALLVAVLLPATEEAGAAESVWQHREHIAYDAYRRGEFERAGELSNDPLLAGAAHYRRGRLEQALAAFSRGDSAAAAFNRGNALARLERFEEAVAAYARAIELDPALDEARYNKRLVELFLEEDEKPDQQASEDSAEEGSAFDPVQQSGAENQTGIGGQISGNPGDQQQQGPGLGASLQSGMIDPFEEFSDSEQRPDRASMMEFLEQPRQQRRVESWISELPVSSAELFRRKFLRDYQRQLRQSR